MPAEPGTVVSAEGRVVVVLDGSVEVEVPLAVRDAAPQAVSAIGAASKTKRTRIFSDRP